MKELIVTVKVPILERRQEGGSLGEHPISDDDIATTVSYVLNTYLEMYCANIGAPKFGLISANGKVSERDLDP